MVWPANDVSMFMMPGWLAASLLITVLVVRGSIGYAHRHDMLDLPGKRRSHQTATPRGGGIGVVVAMLICLPGVMAGSTAGWPIHVTAGLMGGLMFIALAGWWDDHRSLPIRPRLLAQLLGIGLFCAGLLTTGMSWWWLPLLLVAGAWSVNLHNFMDGIDGLLAQQGMFVAAGIALLAWASGQLALALASTMLIFSLAGFWWFNRSPAKIFMGDVGSGSVGLLIFAFSVMLWRGEQALIWPALILSSAFAVDASLTLLTRMLRGRRWYTAHREHLYQWLVRCGKTHGRTGVAFLGWNLLVAAPSAWMAWSHLSIALPITIVVYLCASVVWLALKRRCLRRICFRVRHVAA